MAGAFFGPDLRELVGPDADAVYTVGAGVVLDALFEAPLGGRDLADENSVFHAMPSPPKQPPEREGPDRGGCGCCAHRRRALDEPVAGGGAEDLLRRQVS